MRWRGLGLAAVSALLVSAAPAPAPLSLWRLDCGSIAIKNLSVFSDTFLYAGEQKTLTASCYLIRNGDKLLLWDTGLDGALIGKPQTDDFGTSSLRERVVPQLARIGVKPADVIFVGISHYHDDHTGQAADFPGATLLIGKADYAVVKQWPSAAKRFAHWLTGGGKVEEVAGDKDVFGDGRVTILAMPGHTEGHQALLVQLASGPVLLSGDQYHFTEQVANRGVPTFNTDRAQTLASMDRFERIAANLKAKVIIQHEPGDIARLPAFPEAAQ
jgi:glyoxylase-like metal-dependent hydrolase (beta-lactamase superfamily II)